MLIKKQRWSLWLAAIALCFSALTAQARELPDFTGLVKEASPAVVNISTTKTVERGRQMSPFAGPNGEVPDIFRHFFGDVPGQRGGGTAERKSLGSGFIISHDGYILTNNHVVDGADEIVVRLNDRREVEAKLVGSDPLTDVALLKIDEDDLPVVELGDSDDMQVGEWVLAIGSPFGFDHSVTAGIVSAIGRALPNETYVPFIQTDVAINPGNSGGPLFNLDGKVVGINSQIYTRSGGFMGLSFAIPINVAMRVADQIKESGSVTRGWLGVVIQPVDRDLADSFGLDRPRGALIANVDPDGPAGEAGIKSGDVILSVDGHEINQASDLPPTIGRLAPGDDAEITLMRNREEKTVKVEIGQRPSQRDLASANPQHHGKTGRLGIQVAALPAEMRARWELDGGVLIAAVNPDGAAAKAGLRRGDVIVMLAGKEVSSVDDLTDIVDHLPHDESQPMRIIRKGNPLFVAVHF